MNVPCEILVARLPVPPGASEEKLDDFLRRNGSAALDRVLAAAAPPAPPGTVGLPKLADLDPAAVAADLLAETEVDGLPTLLVREGAAYRWQRDRNCWAVTSDADLKSWVVLQLNARARGVRDRLVKDVLMQLRAQAAVDPGLRSGEWLVHPPPVFWDPVDVLVVPDGLIHLPTLTAGGTDYLHPPTPALFNLTASPVALDLSAAPPAEWLKAIDEIFENAPDQRDTLQELMGYLLTPDTRQQKLFGMIGSGRNGKGLCQRTMTALLGEESVSSLSLSDAKDFKLADLIGKSAWIIGDARSAERPSPLVIERLLSVSGQDRITCDRKYQAPVTVQMTARVLLATNVMPNLPDVSGAVARRFVWILFARSFEGVEDKTLEDRIRQELPGILLWAIAGWRRLRDRGRFEEPASSRRLRDEMEEQGSPIKQFVADECETGAGLEVETGALYQRYQAWCRENGHSPVGQSTLGRDLRAAVPGLERSNARTTGLSGQRKRFYVGVKLIPLGSTGVGAGGPAPLVST